jgi:hypothetical protein
LWGSALLAFLFIPFAYVADLRNGFVDGGGIPCISQLVTGYPCPGCGLTRAFASLTNFDFVSSLRFNPEAILFTVVALVAAISPALLIQSRQRIDAFITRSSNKKSFIIFVAIFISLWILNIIRVSTGFYPAS